MEDMDQAVVMDMVHHNKPLHQLMEVMDHHMEQVKQVRRLHQETPQHMDPPPPQPTLHQDQNLNNLQEELRDPTLEQRRPLHTVVPGVSKRALNSQLQ